MGAFMAVFLVGVLWYVVGVGDAVLYRGRMQDAADAAAYASAVYHARGMNIIALLNLTMAAVLATVVLLTLARLVSFTFHVVACSAQSPPPQLDPDYLALSNEDRAEIASACGKATLAHGQLSSMDAREIIEDAYVVLRALSRAQEGLARDMPKLAEQKAEEVQPLYAGPVTETGMLSASLVTQGDGRLGMPVEQGDVGFLCRNGRMTKLVNEKRDPEPGLLERLLFSSSPEPSAGFERPLWFGKFGFGTGYNEKFAEDFFCEPPAGRNAFVDSRMTPQMHAKRVCKLLGKEGDPTCISEFTIQIENGGFDFPGNQAIGFDDPSLSSVPALEIRPKVIFQGARNGDDFFQVWGGARGELGDAGSGIRKVAAWGQAPDEDTAYEELPRLAVAEAEYYFDPAPGRDRHWDGYKLDMLWQLRWKARLRRLRQPGAQVEAALAGVVSAGPEGVVAGIRGVLSGNQLLGLYRARLEAGPQGAVVDSIGADGSHFREYVIH